MGSFRGAKYPRFQLRSANEKKSFGEKEDNVLCFFRTFHRRTIETVNLVENLCPLFDAGFTAISAFVSRYI